MSKTNNGQDFELLYETYANPQEGEVVNEDTGRDKHELDSLQGLPKNEQVKKAVDRIKTKRYTVDEVMTVTDDEYRDDIMRELRKSDPVEESCGEDHDKDDEEDEEDETVEEKCCEDCGEKECECETVEEGVFDRLKARAGAAKEGIKGGIEGFRKGKGSGFDKKYSEEKTKRILQSHLNKIDDSLSRLVTDVVKLGLMDENEAEKFARQVSGQIRKEFASQNKGRSLSWERGIQNK